MKVKRSLATAATEGCMPAGRSRLMGSPSGSAPCSLCAEGVRGRRLARDRGGLGGAQGSGVTQGQGCAVNSRMHSV